LRSGASDTTFTRRVLSVVRRIPAGRVATYGDVAAAAGRPRAARAVGNIMRDTGARDIPAHRVIAAAGRLGGYGGRPEMKRALLRAEGVLVSGDRIRDFRARRWPKPGKTPGKNAEHSTAKQRQMTATPPPPRVV
jgi:methylated-DNA-[protein]-cysteine S-methyltransferase